MKKYISTSMYFLFLLFTLLIVPLYLSNVFYGIFRFFVYLPNWFAIISISLIFQLGIKGSSVPFFMVKHNDWEKEKYGLFTYKYSLILVLCFSILMVLLMYLFNETDVNGELMKVMFLPSLLIPLNIYIFKRHFDKLDKNIKYGRLSNVCLFVVVALIINISYMTIENFYNPNFEIIQFFKNYKYILSDKYLFENLLIVISIMFFLNFIYLFLDKIFDLSKIFNRNKIILSLLPLYLAYYSATSAIYLLMHEAWETESFTKIFIINSRLIIFLVCFYLIQKINDNDKIIVNKYVFIDRSFKNFAFTFLALLLFNLYLLYEIYVEGVALPLSFFYSAGLLSLVPLYIARQKNQIDFLLQDKIKILQESKEKTDNLLANIFPKSIAAELSENGNVISKGFDEVSILFTDFKNFTNISSAMSPEKLVDELNDIFHAFDSIIEEQGVEKIKTIGDSYMVVCGAPSHTVNHAEKCIDTGLKMIHCLEKRNEKSGVKWEMRVGVHSGKVVAGVVCKNRFTYDIWGDAVNLASRVESLSHPNKVNISGITFDFVKNIYEFDYRGKIDSKGKGELDMYFVNKKIS